MAQSASSNELTIKNWQKMWDSDQIGFHQSSVHPDLMTYESEFLDKNCRVFLPLCGKTLDLVYLADKGHEVFGCEFVQKACEDFFKEQSLEYETLSLPSGLTKFKATSKKITLYCGDFFALKSEEIGKFNAVWDRASLVAINPSQRIEYGKVMQDLMVPGGKYLLNSFIFTGENYRGPPHSVPREDIKSCFGSFCEIKELDSKFANFPLKNVKSTEVINHLLVSKL